MIKGEPTNDKFLKGGETSDTNGEGKTISKSDDEKASR